MEPSSGEQAGASGHDVQRAVGAVGEPTRFRIVELLATRPHTVGELAEALSALQPQTTKHIQALEAAGVVTVHRLGRRRVVQLDRATLARIGRYFSGLAESVASPDEAVLEAYAAGIATESARPPAASRRLRFERSFEARAADVWAAWVEPEQAARWWAPRHFTVESFQLEPHPGGRVRVTLSEGGGASYRSAGHVESVGPGRLVFLLAPVDGEGEPLFTARHTLEIAGDLPSTMTLDIDVVDVRRGAAPAVAGLEPGWSQLFDNLAGLLGEV